MSDTLSFAESLNEDLVQFDLLHRKQMTAVNDFWETRTSAAYKRLLNTNHDLISHARQSIQKKNEDIEKWRKECLKRGERLTAVNNRITLARKELDGSTESIILARRELDGTAEAERKAKTAKTLTDKHVIIEKGKGNSKRKRESASNSDPPGQLE